MKNEPTMRDNSAKTRRSFLKYLMSIGITGFLASVLYPLIAYLKPPKQSEVEVSSVNIGKAEDYAKADGKIVRFGNKPVILVHGPDGYLRAFIAVCTHLDCTVQFRKDLGVIWCACHNGEYNLTGKNISGPPPRPLTELVITKKGDNLFLSKKA